MKRNGSDILVECLLEQGVDTVFGYPGGAVLNIYDALYKYSGRIRHVLTAHEQGASHAADGYARATGRVGVCTGGFHIDNMKPEQIDEVVKALDGLANEIVSGIAGAGYRSF